MCSTVFQLERVGVSLSLSLSLQKKKILEDTRERFEKMCRERVKVENADVVKVDRTGLFNGCRYFTGVNSPRGRKLE